MYGFLDYMEEKRKIPAQLVLQTKRFNNSKDYGELQEKWENYSKWKYKNKGYISKVLQLKFSKYIKFKRTKWLQTKSNETTIDGRTLERVWEENEESRMLD